MTGAGSTVVTATRGARRSGLRAWAGNAPASSVHASSAAAVRANGRCGATRRAARRKKGKSDGKS
jgi:hypothetical protein